MPEGDAVDRKRLRTVVLTCAKNTDSVREE
jgi:hypothetical protein